MAKTKISEYSSTSSGANLNTDIASINIDEGCSPANINNAIRALMAQIKDLQSGASGDTLPVTAGGTGSTTASDARTALSAAKSGANSDITSITGLTTVLSTAQGGTGSNATTYCSLSTNVTGTLPVANGGTGGANATTARSNLGLGTSAVLDVGTTASKVVQLDSSAKLPAVDGSQLTNISNTTLLGTLTTTSGTSASLGSLTLTDYKMLTLVLSGVSENSTTNSSLSLATSNGAPCTGGLGSSSDGFYGQITIDLSTGVFWSNTVSQSTSSPQGNGSNTYAGICGYTTASTSITVYTKGATFDAGSIKVYGIK